MTESRWADRPAGFWDAVETDYRGGTRLTEIYARFELSKGEFDYHRDQAGWPRRNYAPVHRERLVRRLLWLVNKHVIHMEKNVTAGNEKDIALLHDLVDTVSKLIRFERATTPIDKRKGKTRSLAGTTDKLMVRIDELQRR